MKLIIMIALLTPTFAFSANWQNVSAGGDTVVSVDVESVVVLKNGVRKFWVEYLHGEPQVSKQGKKYQRVVTLDLAKCNDRTTATEQEILYDKLVSGSVVQSTSFRRATLDYLEVVPESFGEAVLSFVCSAKLK